MLISLSPHQPITYVGISHFKIYIPSPVGKGRSNSTAPTIVHGRNSKFSNIDVKNEIKRIVMESGEYISVSIAAMTGGVSIYWSTPMLPKFHDNETGINITEVRCI